MVEVNGLKFETSIGVLFALKEMRGHKTLQETYASVSNSGIDNVIEVMHVCYKKGMNSTCTFEEFIDIIAKHDLGFIKLTRLYTEVLERLMYDGLTKEEIDASKKQIEERIKKT